jgi:hypothetical protein
MMTQEILNFLEKFKITIRSYCTPLINPGEYPPKDMQIGSGTFVIMANKKGILTNEHVAQLFYSQKSNRLWVSDCNENLQELAFSLIIKLVTPVSPNPDVAFILLDDESCDIVTNKLNKQFWNIDQNSLNHNNKNCIWMVWGNVNEGRVYNKNPKLSRPFFYFKNAVPYVVVPDIDNIEYIQSDCGDFKVLIDLVNCPIATKDQVPNKFDGMSGAGLWQIEIGKNGEPQKVFLVGIATEYVPSEKLICRGSSMLYHFFYPFVCGVLCANALHLDQKSKIGRCFRQYD